jgi:hypothetical protein
MTTLAHSAKFALAALTVVSIASAAEAGGRKGYFVKDYTVAGPAHGYSGRAGNYWCDYVRHPNRVCDADGNNCKIVSWTLRQTCY